MKLSHQTQCVNLSGQVVFFVRWLERELTCYGGVKHLLPDSINPYSPLPLGHTNTDPYSLLYKMKTKSEV